MRLRFTIRDLLWLTLVVAMGLGWWLDHTDTSQIKSERGAIHGAYLNALEQQQVLERRIERMQRAIPSRPNADDAAAPSTF
jgi:hypothetical protein